MAILQMLGCNELHGYLLFRPARKRELVHKQWPADIVVNGAAYDSLVERCTMVNLLPHPAPL